MQDVPQTPPQDPPAAASRGEDTAPDRPAAAAAPERPLAHVAPPEWLLFDRPLFLDAAQRNLARVGVVDVGSNSVRLVVFDGAARSPAYFFNEKILCGLGRDLDLTGRLHPDGRRRALAALQRFQVLAEAMGIAPLAAVATAAVREAADGAAFCAEVLETTGLRLHVLASSLEAQLSAEGVLLGWPDAEGLVCDMGGASVELAEVAGGRVGGRASAALGSLKLQALVANPAALDRHIAATLAQLTERMGTDPARLYLVGGSWRAFARIDMLRRDYPLTVLHEYRMSPADIRATAALIARTDLRSLHEATATSLERLALIPAASRVLRQLVRSVHAREIAISTYGIREGLLWRQMPEELRRRDPLIEACRFAERKDARLPGFGKKLFQFLLPVFPGLDARRLRLMRAACLLHDVAWRASPDYRHEVTFENATRANLGGLTHPERIFLGLALLHRYKNSREGWKNGALLSLLPAAEVRRAETLGKAMRFGAMFALSEPEGAGALRLLPRRKVLQLTLTERGRKLYGEVAALRLASLASALGVAVEVR